MGKVMLDTVALILVTIIMGSFGQVCMKKGVNSTGGIKLEELLSTKLFSTIFEPNILIGIILYGAASLLWFVVLSKADLSFAYPMLAIGYILTAFLARVYFNENITIIKWFGILLILGGVFLVSRA